jgi:hypothetical protein
MVAAYEQAELDVLEGKETQVNGRRFVMEDLDKIRKGRREWERKVRSLEVAHSSGGSSGVALASFN